MSKTYKRLEEFLDLPEIAVLVDTARSDDVLQRSVGVLAVEDKVRLYAAIMEVSDLALHITKIPEAMFRFSPLDHITIPSSVTSIGVGAFAYCGGLQDITIPDSVLTIGMYAFHCCVSLENVVIGNGVTSIGNRSFDNCGSLTRVTIGNSVTSIGDSAFYNCRSLTELMFNGTKEQWNAIYKGYHWNAFMPATTITCSDGSLSNYER